MESRAGDPAAPAPRHEDSAGPPAGPGDGESPAEARWRRIRVVGRYEDFLRCSVDWLWETDADLVLTYVSSPVALKLGIPAQVLIGRPLPSLGRFEAAADPGRPNLLRTQRPFRHVAFAMTGADRGTVSYLLSGVPYYHDPDGRFAGFRGTALAAPPPAESEPADEDLAALSRTLEEALLRNAELSARLSLLGGIAAEPGGEPSSQPARAPTPAPGPAPEPPAMEPPVPVPLARTAHELRTPLNAVIGYADLGLNQMFGPVGERYLDCFRSIREAGRHMDELVAGLQDSVRRPGAADLTVETVEIADVVAKAKAMIALAAREAEVDISRVGPMAGGRALGDRRACVQIVLNLLSNAVKYTPAGGSVGLETLAGPDNTLQIVVWDSGPGIALEEQRKIFEPDYRAAEVRRANNIPGSGLGLSISRDLARAMGGELSAISQPGQGSRFILSLPLAAPAPPNA